MPGMVDLNWILLVLSTLTRGEHPYFAKDFVPQPTPKKQQNNAVDNSDNFFEGLPKTKNPSRGRFLFNQKSANRQQEKLKKLQEEQELLESRLKQKRELIEALQSEKPQQVNPDDVLELFQEVLGVQEQSNR